MTTDMSTNDEQMQQRITPNRRLSYIDGIRGASACYVVLFHMYQFASVRFSGATPSWWKAFSVFQYGDCGVAVFIVVSGYCLMLPVAANEELELRGGRMEFAKRRLRRLGPGYLAALAGSSLLILAIPALHHRSGTVWDVSLPAFSLGTIIAHLLLVYNWSRTWRYEIDTPMWTVALEVQIYAVFVFGLLPLWRRSIGRRPNLVVVLACAVITAALMALGLAWAQPWMLVLFAFGMCAAEATQRPTGWIPRMVRGRVDLVVITALVVVGAFFAVEGSLIHTADGLLFARGLMVGSAAAVLLLGLRLASTGDGRLTTLIGRALSIRPLSWLGEISYSLYLVHFPIIGAVTLTWVYRSQLNIPENFALIVLVAGSLSLIVAVGFHRLFERRYLLQRQPTLATVTTSD